MSACEELARAAFAEWWPKTHDFFVETLQQELDQLREEGAFLAGYRAALERFDREAELVDVEKEHLLLLEMAIRNLHRRGWNGVDRGVIVMRCRELDRLRAQRAAQPGIGGPSATKAECPSTGEENAKGCHGT